MMNVRMVPALLAMTFAWPAGAAGPPPDSIYQLATPLTTQSAEPATLDLYRGQPVLVSMFYGSCPHVCPMLISTIQRMERELSAPQRARVRVLLVSIDPERDTPQRLAELAARHGADLSRWTFARPQPGDVRKLAAVLGIQYRQLPDGAFNHSTVVTLLDREGRPGASTSQMLRLEPEFLQALRAATAD